MKGCWILEDFERCSALPLSLSPVKPSCSFWCAAANLTLSPRVATSYLNKNTSLKMLLSFLWAAFRFWSECTSHMMQQRSGGKDFSLVVSAGFCSLRGVGFSSAQAEHSTVKGTALESCMMMAAKGINKSTCSLIFLEVHSGCVYFQCSDNWAWGKRTRIKHILILYFL